VLAEPVILCPPRAADLTELRAVRERNAAWLAESQSSHPPPRGGPATAMSARSMAEAGVRLLLTRLQARHSSVRSWAVRYAGRVVGEVSLFDIAQSPTWSAKVGYWIDHEHTGLGIASVAVALACDHGFSAMGLHRIEAGIRPENAPSRRLAARLGFREEGTCRRNVHVAGDWRDHVLYAALDEDYPEGVLAGLRAGARR
jgi:ribosomal-protein-alanine N-acetyltransferase